MLRKNGQFRVLMLKRRSDKSVCVKKRSVESEYVDQKTFTCECMLKRRAALIDYLSRVKKANS